MAGRRCLALVAVALVGSACAPVETTEIRVRDPAQIAVERVTKSGTVVSLVPPHVRSVKRTWRGRDIDGFPLLGEAGHWLIQSDGALAVEGSPSSDGAMLRVPTTMLADYRPCRRNPSRMCGKPIQIEFVTPWSNVVSVRTREGPIRSETEP